MSYTKAQLLFHCQQKLVLGQMDHPALLKRIVIYLISSPMPIAVALFIASAFAFAF